MRQLPTFGSFGYQHRVGTSMPIARAASRIVAPSRTVTSLPLTVRVGMPSSGEVRVEGLPYI